MDHDPRAPTRPAGDAADPDDAREPQAAAPRGRLDSQRTSSLRAALARQQALLAAIPDIIMEVDVGKVYTWANQAGLEFFGDDVVGREAAHYFVDQQDTYHQVEPLFAGEQRTFYVESWQRRRDGEARLLAWWCRALADESGRVVGALSTARDVTDERRAVGALREAEERFRTFFDNAPIGKSMTSPDGRLLRVNPALAAMLGYSVEELQTVSFAAITHPDDLPESVECVRSLLAGERDRWTMEKRYVAKDGHPVWTRVVTRLQRDALGKPLHFLTHVQDITERKLAEEERRDLQARLAQADRLASMGMLAAGVAHEINNPLSYVLYNVESLADDLPKLAELMHRTHALLAARLGPEAAAAALGDGLPSFSPAACDDALERLREALAGLRRIKNIVRGLGAFSRVESAERKPVDLAACIEHAALMAANELKYRARLVKDLAPLPPVLGSEGKLAQVFLNLLLNAAHAIDEGHVERNEVRIRTWSEGDTVCAEVADTGRGIAPEHRSRIFEPFFTTKNAGAGSGLGLAICRGLVAELGGSLSFTSEVGRGSQFVVRLPRLPDRWRPSVAPPGAAPSAPASRVRGRVLVVDDEDGIRSSIVRMLRDDHEVVTADSGLAARELLEHDRRFDVVYCDLMMPSLSGMELHAWLAGQDPELAERVVFITGGAFTPGAADYLALVGNLRVEKPLDVVAFRKLTGELVLAARARLGA